MTFCVSYVATFYNKEPYLPFVLEGLKSQEGDFRREFIFVDDGSTDGTVGKLRSLTAGWADPVIIIEQENQGPSVALNTGLRAISGDFVKPLDGDDMLNPWCTRILLECLQAYQVEIAHGLISPVSYDCQGDDTPQEFSKRQKEPEMDPVFHENAMERSLQRSRTNPTAWLATADLVKRSGGCDTRVFIQDYSIELRLMYHAGKTVCTPRHVHAGPAEAPGRLSDNEAQLLHDVNMALAGFLDGHPLPLTLKMMAYKRALRRCWAWERRRNGRGGMLSPEFRGFLRVFLPVGLDPDMIRTASRVFRHGNTLRIPEASN